MWGTIWASTSCSCHPFICKEVSCVYYSVYERAFIAFIECCCTQTVTLQQDTCNTLNSLGGWGLQCLPYVYVFLLKQSLRQVDNLSNGRLNGYWKSIPVETCLSVGVDRRGRWGKSTQSTLSKVTSALDWIHYCSLHGCVLECTMTNVFPECSRLELIYLRRTPLHAQPLKKIQVMLAWQKAGIDENQIATSTAWMCVGIWPEAECIPADRHYHKTCPVRGLLCHLPALKQAQESSLPSVFAAIPHQRSPLQTRQNNLPFPFSMAHTHTALLVCLKQPRPHWLGIFPCVC